MGIEEARSNHKISIFFLNSYVSMYAHALMDMHMNAHTHTQI